MTDRARDHVLAIDLVRFASALLVVAHHYAATFPLAPPPELRAALTAAALPRDWVWWSWSGWVGVEIFFVVSGYVIARSAREVTARAFLARRLLRLVPAAWLCAALTAAVLLAGGYLTGAAAASRWLAAATFFPFAPAIDGSYWTLAIEFAFYVAVAALLATKRGPATLERLALALALSSLVFWPTDGDWSANDAGVRAAGLLLLPHGCFFAIGIALWSVREHGVSALRLATLAIGLIAGVVEIGGQARAIATGLAIDAGAGVPLALFATAIAAIALADRLQAPLARSIGAGRLALLGAVTYPLYLLHQQLGGVTIAALARAGVGGHLAMVLTALVMLALAAAVARWAEPWLKRWLAAALSARRGRATDTHPTPSLPAG